jgi:hypothetical protein
VHTLARLSGSSHGGVLCNFTARVTALQIKATLDVPACRILTEETTLVDDLEIVRTARMPLLKAKLSGGIQLKVTLSPLDVKDIPACQTAELVSKTFKKLPHARKLLLILKALMRPPNCLSSLVGVHTGGVSSYTVTLMVLAFCKFQVGVLLFRDKQSCYCVGLKSLSMFTDSSYQCTSLFTIRPVLNAKFSCHLAGCSAEC